MKLKIEYVNKEALKPYANNAKIHTAEQVEQIKKSIEQFGFNDPIALWHENEVIEGHGRLLAVMEMDDIKKVPVIRLDDLTDEQRKAYMLVNNKLTMNTDFDFDLLNAELNDVVDIDMEQFGFVETCIEEINFDEFDKQLSNLEGEELVSLSVSVPASKKSFVNEYLRNGEADTAIGRGKGVLKRCELH